MTDLDLEVEVWPTPKDAARHRQLVNSVPSCSRCSPFSYPTLCNTTFTCKAFRP